LIGAGLQIGERKNTIRVADCSAIGVLVQTVRSNLHFRHSFSIGRVAGDSVDKGSRRLTERGK
jgi:hypothetical protein